MSIKIEGVSFPREKFKWIEINRNGKKTMKKVLNVTPIRDYSEMKYNKKSTSTRGCFNGTRKCNIFNKSTTDSIPYKIKRNMRDCNNTIKRTYQRCDDACRRFKNRKYKARKLTSSPFAFIGDAVRNCRGEEVREYRAMGIKRKTKRKTKKKTKKKTKRNKRKTKKN